MIFVKLLGSQNYLRGKTMVLKGITGKILWPSKRHYWTGIGLLNTITGWEFGAQISWDRKILVQ